MKICICLRLPLPMLPPTPPSQICDDLKQYTYFHATNSAMFKIFGLAEDRACLLHQKCMKIPTKNPPKIIFAYIIFSYALGNEKKPYAHQHTTSIPSFKRFDLIVCMCVCVHVWCMLDRNHHECKKIIFFSCRLMSMQTRFKAHRESTSQRKRATIITGEKRSADGICRKWERKRQSTRNNEKMRICCCCDCCYFSPRKILFFPNHPEKNPFFSCHQKVPDFRFSSYQFESRECQSDKQKNDNISTNLYLAFCCWWCCCCCCWWVWVCLCVCKSNWIGMNECMDTTFFHIRPTQRIPFPPVSIVFRLVNGQSHFSPHTNYVTRDFSCFVSHPIVFIFHCHAFFLVQFSHHQRKNSFQIAAFIFFSSSVKNIFWSFSYEKKMSLWAFS